MMSLISISILLLAAIPYTFESNCKNNMGNIPLPKILEGFYVNLPEELTCKLGLRIDIYDAFPTEWIEGYFESAKKNILSMKSFSVEDITSGHKFVPVEYEVKRRLKAAKNISTEVEELVKYHIVYTFGGYYLVLENFHQFSYSSVYKGLDIKEACTADPASEDCLVENASFYKDAMEVDDLVKIYIEDISMGHVDSLVSVVRIAQDMMTRKLFQTRPKPWYYNELAKHEHTRKHVYNLLKMLAEASQQQVVPKENQEKDKDDDMLASGL